MSPETQGTYPTYGDSGPKRAPAGPPKNGKYHVALLVGGNGSRLGSIVEYLARLRIVARHHRDYEKAQAMLDARVPSDVDLVLIFVTHLSHKASDAWRNAARKASVRFVLLPLQKSGWASRFNHLGFRLSGPGLTPDEMRDALLPHWSRKMESLQIEAKLPIIHRLNGREEPINTVTALQALPPASDLKEIIAVQPPKRTPTSTLMEHQARRRLLLKETEQVAEEVWRRNPTATWTQVRRALKRRFGERREFPRHLGKNHAALLKSLGYEVSGRGRPMQNGKELLPPKRLDLPFNDPAAGSDPAPVLGRPPRKQRTAEKGDDVRAAAGLLRDAMAQSGEYRSITVHSDGRVEVEVVQKRGFQL